MTGKLTAAERRQGDELFNLPYVIADTTPKNRDRSIKEWKAKGVEPVLYVKGGKNHPNLHNTLKAWAAHTRDGLGSKQRIIRTKAILDPVPPYDQDESIQQVIDTLKERVDGSDQSINGHAAKVFSELESPAAPLSWLPILEGEGLLSIASENSGPKLINSNSIGANIIAPNKISSHLWRWLLKYLEDDDFIRWVIDKGICLHPQFKDMVEWELKQKTFQKSYNDFWRIVTSDYIRCCRSSPLEGVDVVDSLIKGPDALSSLAFAKLIEPSFEVSKSFYWPEDYEEEELTPDVPYTTDVDIALKDWVFQKGYTDLMVDGAPSPHQSDTTLRWLIDRLRS